MKKEIELKVNQKLYNVFIEPRDTLIEVLREYLCFTDVKASCEMGECGACTVLIDGYAVRSCLMLAVQAQGKEITTIEGIKSKDGELHPLQQSFIDNFAFQCGFCTPGMILSAKALLDKNPNPSIEEVREALSGNICRCTGYASIIEAVLEASKKIVQDEQQK